MSETPRPSCSPSDPRWVTILDYTIGTEDAVLPFTARLARENGWSAAFAARVVTEYKRFVWLALVAGHPVTPSDAVDQAWHLHLLDTRDYWDRFCPEVLGQPLHHVPTRGGAAEMHRFHAQYAATLASYERHFGGNAPADIWPDAATRLIDDPRARRVHPRDAFIIRKPWARRQG